MFNKINKDKLRIITEILFLLIFVILFRNKELQKWIIVFAGGAVASLFFGRFYCGWICPIGTLMRFQSWIYKKLGIERFKTPNFMKNKWLRWLWLILFVGFMIMAKKFGLKVNMLLYVVFIGVLISFFFKEELWHKYICPYGTILSVTTKPTKKKLEINKNKCIACGLCEKECINNTITELSDGKRKINHQECLLCFKCQEVCPVDAIKYIKSLNH
jgi:ferredoxin-type protein NapH